MQPIVAAACLGRVEFQSQIVPANEPVEGALRVLIPTDVGCGAVGFQTSRYRGLRLNGLLIEIGARAATAIEPVAADRLEVTLLGSLDGREPAQGLQPAFQRQWLSGGLAAQYQSVRELRVVVRQLLFKPLPVRMRACLEALHEPASQHLPGLVHHAITAQAAQVFMDADQAERPRPRRREPRERWQRQREELSGHHLETPKGRTPHAYAQRPERAPVRVLRSLFVEPATVKAHVVVEAIGLEIEGMMEEGGGSACQ